MAHGIANNVVLSPRALNQLHAIKTISVRHWQDWLFQGPALYYYTECMYTSKLKMLKKWRYSQLGMVTKVQRQDSIIIEDLNGMNTLNEKIIIKFCCGYKFVLAKDQVFGKIVAKGIFPFRSSIMHANSSKTEQAFEIVRTPALYIVAHYKEQQLLLQLLVHMHSIHTTKSVLQCNVQGWCHCYFNKRLAQFYYCVHTY